MWLTVSVMVAPLNAFDRLKEADYLGMALLLTAIRWTVTPLNTVWRMYAHESPMLFRPLFGMDEKTYRFWEIFWYGPYGVLLTLAIAAVVCQLARRFAPEARPTFRKTFELVALTFFTPWLASVPGDIYLVHAANAAPRFLVPFHLAILTLECFLISLGFHRMYGIPFWRRCTVLGFAAGILFVVLGGVVIR